MQYYSLGLAVSGGLTASNAKGLKLGSMSQTTTSSTAPAISTSLPGLQGVQSTTSVGLTLGKPSSTAPATSQLGALQASTATAIGGGSGGLKLGGLTTSSQATTVPSLQPYGLQLGGTTTSVATSTIGGLGGLKGLGATTQPLSITGSGLKLAGGLTATTTSGVTTTTTQAAGGATFKGLGGVDPSTLTGKSTQNG